jgi:probable HAF family extracellular repeat protein
MWSRVAVAVAATVAVGAAHADWIAASVQATSGQTYLQVVNDQGQAAGFARTSSTRASRVGPVTTFSDRALFLDGQGVLSEVGLTGTSTSATVKGASALDINRNGQVLFGGSFGIRLYSPGALTPLTTVAGSPVAINDAGQQASTVQIGPYADGVNHLALGRTDGSFQDLGALGGKKSQAMALNNLGQVVGFSQFAGSPGAYDTRAVLYEGQSLIDLGQLLSPTASSFATGINDAGTVIGSLLTASGNRAFIYRDGTMSVVALNGGTGVGTTTAAAVNAASQVLLTSCAVATGCEVKLEDRGQISVLGQLAGVDTQGVALNDRGQALVSATINGDLDYALWDHGTMLNLDELVAGLGFTDVAYATLANGYLAGYGTLASGQTQSFLLRDTGNAVPEPASLLLSLGALGLAGLVGRRRTR